MWVGQIANIISIVFFIGTGIGILYPAVTDEKGLTQIIVSLFQPEWTQEFVFRWLLVLMFSCSAYVLIIAYIFRRTPITILRSDFEMKFESADGSRVSINRTQTLRANQPNVTAFYGHHRPDNGSIPKGGIEANIFCQSCNTSSYLEIFGREDSGLEIMQVFDEPLPYSWFVPLIPVSLLNKKYDDLPNFFKRRLVKRTLKFVYVGEFNVTDPVMRFASGTYPQKCVRFSLEFSKKALPHDVTVRRIRVAGVIDHPIEKNEHIFRTYIPKIQNETILFSWKPAANATKTESGSAEAR